MGGGWQPCIVLYIRHNSRRRAQRTKQPGGACVCGWRPTTQQKNTPHHFTRINAPGARRIYINGVQMLLIVFVNIFFSCFIHIQYWSRRILTHAWRRCAPPRRMEILYKKNINVMCTLFIVLALALSKSRLYAYNHTCIYTVYICKFHLILRTLNWRHRHKYVRTRAARQRVK